MKVTVLFHLFPNPSKTSNLHDNEVVIGRLQQLIFLITCCFVEASKPNGLVGTGCHVWMNSIILVMSSLASSSFSGEQLLNSSCFTEVQRKASG